MMLVMRISGYKSIKNQMNKVKPWNKKHLKSKNNYKRQVLRQSNKYKKYPIRQNNDRSQIYEKIYFKIKIEKYYCFPLLNTYFQRMLISPVQFLSLTDQLTLMTSKCKVLEEQNIRLTTKVTQQSQSINLLNQRLAQQIRKNKKTQVELINFISNKSDGVMNSVSESQQQQMKFLQEQIQKIKSDANVQKIRQLQKKMTDIRFKNHQMVDFYQKIQSLFMVLNNTRTPPSMNQLYKWATLRKADQLNVSTISNTNNVNLQGTQKSIMNSSKINMSKMNTSKLNISKINNKMEQSRINIMTSNFNGSKIKNNTLMKQSGINDGRKNMMNSSQVRPTQKNNSPMKNQMNISKIKTKGKQNISSIQKPPKDKRKGQKKRQSKKQQVHILSTDSITQQVNLENEVSLNQFQNKLFSNHSSKKKVEDNQSEVI